MNSLEAKIIGLVVTLIIPFCCTIAPYWVSPWIAKKGARGERILCYLMCFGGGIFFGTFLLHIAPEVRLLLDTALLEPNEITYPVTDLIIGCGFFFVLYLEKIVMRINKRRMQKKRKMKDSCIISHQVPYGTVCANCKDGKPCLGQVNEGHQNDSDVVVNSRIAIQVKDIESSGPVKSKSSDPEEIFNDLVEEKLPRYVEKTSEYEATDTDSDRSQHEEEHAGHHNMRSLILIIALSLHHIFEGLALGLQSTAQRVFTLLIALMCHETIISFSLGLQFVKSKYSFKRMLITTFCCSIIMPIGVSIGMIMSELGSNSKELDIVNGVVQAFACGTFIFVTFFEILQEEINPHDTSIGKVTGAFLGFVVMALLTLVPEEPAQNPTDSETTTISQNLSTIYALL